MDGVNGSYTTIYISSDSSSSNEFCNYESIEQVDGHFLANQANNIKVDLPPSHDSDIAFPNLYAPGEKVYDEGDYLSEGSEAESNVSLTDFSDGSGIDFDPGSEWECSSPEPGSAHSAKRKITNKESKFLLKAPTSCRNKKKPSTCTKKQKLLPDASNPALLPKTTSSLPASSTVPSVPAPIPVTSSLLRLLSIEIVPPVDQSPEQLTVSEISSLRLLDQPIDWTLVDEHEPPIDVREQFTVSNAGPKGLPKTTRNPLDFLLLFMTKSVWVEMVNATNRYAHAVIEVRSKNGMLGQYSRINDWIDVTIGEMGLFMALLINMGLNNIKNIEHYWSPESNLYVPFFSRTMSYRRFKLIMSMFHVSSEVSPSSGESKHDLWINIRTFTNSLNEAFKSYFIPNQELCVEESFMGIKNRSPTIEYTPDKCCYRCGVKKFDLCDSRTGYILQSVFLSSKEFLARGQLAFTECVIDDLMVKSTLWNKHYHLFVESYYTKVPLAHWLYEHKTYFTGQIKKGSKELSNSVNNAKPVPGEPVYFREGNILLVKYVDYFSKKQLHLLTTGYNATNTQTMSRGSKVQVKPVAVKQYNQYMGDGSKDKSIHHITCLYRTKKYWRKIVFNFIDMALLNSYILYKHFTIQAPMDRFDFICSIIKGLVSYEFQPDKLNILDPNHRLENLPESDKCRLTKVCIVCKENGKHKRSTSWCPGCGIGVHKHCFQNLEHFLRSPAMPKKTSKEKKVVGTKKLSKEIKPNNTIKISKDIKLESE